MSFFPFPTTNNNNNVMDTHYRPTKRAKLVEDSHRSSNSGSPVTADGAQSPSAAANVLADPLTTLYPEAPGVLDHAKTGSAGKSQKSRDNEIAGWKKDIRLALEEHEKQVQELLMSCVTCGTSIQIASQLKLTRKNTMNRMVKAAAALTRCGLLAASTEQLNNLLVSSEKRAIEALKRVQKDSTGPQRTEPDNSLGSQIVSHQSRHVVASARSEPLPRTSLEATSYQGQTACTNHAGTALSRQNFQGGGMQQPIGFSGNDSSVSVSQYPGGVKGAILLLGGSQTEEQAIDAVMWLKTIKFSDPIAQTRYQQEFLDLGGFAILVCSLRRFQNSEESHFAGHALDVLLKMIKSGAAEVLIRLDFLDALLSLAIETYPESKGIQELAVLLFAKLAKIATPQSKVTLGSGDIVHFVINLLIAFADDTKMVGAASSYFAYVSEVPGVTARLLENKEGLLEIPVSVLPTPPHLTLSSSVVHLFSNMVVSANPQSRIQLGTDRIVQFMVNSMNSYPDNRSIVLAACIYFEKLCWVPEVKNRLLQKELLIPVASVFQKFSNFNDVIINNLDRQHISDIVKHSRVVMAHLSGCTAPINH